VSAGLIWSRKFEGIVPDFFPGPCRLVTGQARQRVACARIAVWKTPDVFDGKGVRPMSVSDRIVISVADAAVPALLVQTRQPGARDQ
jgi:hypothetical protein